MKTRHVIKIIVLIVILAFYYTNSEFFIPQDIIEQKSRKNVEYNLKEEIFKDIEVVFCPSNECYKLFADEFQNAKKKIRCSFYEFDVKNLSKILEQKANQNVTIELVIDNDYLEEEGLKIIKNNSKIKIISDIGNSKYMHNKFCIIDEQTLITGSTNPTENGFFRNNNNIIKIDSFYLSKNYENEFEQLFSQKFGYTKQSVLEYNNITLKYENSTYTISSYFCPQDNCPKQVLNTLSKAQEEILFATFAFTYDDYTSLLISKMNENINVTGVIEKRNRNLMGSDYQELNNSINIYLDENPYNMHHKVFVVDEQYVITGSMNPSQNAAKYNDENILIINNPKIAKAYKNEILSLIS